MQNIPSYPRILLFAALLIPMVFCGSACQCDDTQSPPITGNSDSLPLGFVDVDYFEMYNLNTENDVSSVNEDPNDPMPEWLSVTNAGSELMFSGTPPTEGEFSFNLKMVDGFGDALPSLRLRLVVVTSIDLTGDWNFSTSEIEANGACAGETQPSTFLVTIAQEGSLVTVSGFLGIPTNILSGDIDGSHVEFNGSYAEGEGTTSANYVMTIYSASYFKGVEYWNWTDGIGSCTGSSSIIKATKVNPN